MKTQTNPDFKEKLAKVMTRVDEYSETLQLALKYIDLRKKRPKQHDEGLVDKVYDTYFGEDKNENLPKQP